MPKLELLLGLLFSVSALEALSSSVHSPSRHLSPLGHSPAMLAPPVATRARAARCCEERERSWLSSQLRKPAVGGVIFGALYFSQFGVLIITALGRLGLVTVPPLNTYTAIANNAMDAGIADGSVFPLMATAYAQGLWFDLVSSYYQIGPQFLDAYCAEADHLAWCAGVTLP